MSWTALCSPGEQALTTPTRYEHCAPPPGYDIFLTAIPPSFFVYVERDMLDIMTI
jgi:hypothetical protein